MAINFYITPGGYTRIFTVFKGYNGGEQGPNANVGIPHRNQAYGNSGQASVHEWSGPINSQFIEPGQVRHAGQRDQLHTQSWGNQCRATHWHPSLAPKAIIGSRMPPHNLQIPYPPGMKVA